MAISGVSRIEGCKHLGRVVENAISVGYRRMYAAVTSGGGLGVGQMAACRGEQITHMKEQVGRS